MHAFLQGRHALSDIFPKRLHSALHTFPQFCGTFYIHDPQGQRSYQHDSAQPQC